MFKYVFLGIMSTGLVCSVASSAILLLLEKKPSKQLNEEPHEEKIQRLKGMLIPLLVVLGVCNHGKSMDEVKEIQKYSPKQLGV